MKKSELVSLLAEKTGGTKRSANAFLDALRNVCHERLAVGEDVNINGVGRLSTVFRAGRDAKNPRTGEPVVIDAYRAVAFRAARKLKKALL